MIKKLRRRFITVIMSIVFLIMSTLLTAVYIYMYRAEEKDSDSTIGMAFMQRGMNNDERRSENRQDMRKPENEKKQSDDADEDKDSGKTQPPEKKSAEPDKRGENGNKPPEMKGFDPNKNKPGDQIEFNDRMDLNLQRLFGVNDRFNTGWIRIKVADGEVESIFRSQRRPSEDEEEEQQAEQELTDIAEKVMARGSKDGRMTAYGVHYKYSWRLDTIVLLDVTQQDQTLGRLLIILIVIFIVLMIVFFIIAVFLAKWVSVPIEKAWNDQNEFFSNASHELKTPLAVISANLDVIRRSPEDGKKERLFEIIHDETDKMSGLISQMLYLSREEYSRNIIMTDVDLSHQVESVCLSVEALAFEKGKILESDIKEGIIVNGDRESLDRVIHILTDNAISHSPKGSQISVRLKNAKGKAVLSVSNEGEIPVEELSHIFDRFYRTDASRSRETGGFGLGLAIAKAIAERHKGTVKAEVSDGRTVFKLELPCKS